MAKKSKTQRAKASARRQEKKAAAIEAAENPDNEVEETEEENEKPKKSLFSKSEDKSEPEKSSKKAAVKAPKTRFKFLRDVKAEMKRVTWPTRQDVLQWSGVVVVALLFFGLYVFVLDDGIVTPLLVAFSGLR